MKIYPAILDFFENGGEITETFLIKYDLHLNENDKQHLKSLFQYLALQPNILVCLRAHLRHYKDALEKAISLVALFKSVDRPYLRDLIIGDGIHNEDAEIIVDAYYWSNGKTDPKFITIEREAIENNRDRILHVLKRQCIEFPETNLELLNIRELS